jgi:hypothetical protein
MFPWATTPLQNEESKVSTCVAFKVQNKLTACARTEPTKHGQEMREELLATLKDLVAESHTLKIDSHLSNRSLDRALPSARARV